MCTPESVTTAWLSSPTYSKRCRIDKKNRLFLLHLQGKGGILKGLLHLARSKHSKVSTLLGTAAVTELTGQLLKDIFIFFILKNISAVALTIIESIVFNWRRFTSKVASLATILARYPASSWRASSFKSLNDWFSLSSGNAPLLKEDLHLGPGNGVLTPAGRSSRIFVFHQKVGTTDLRWCLGGWLSGTVPLRLFRELEEHFQNRELIYE